MCSKRRTHDVQLAIVLEAEKVTIANENNLNLDPANNVDALRLQGKDLDKVQLKLERAQQTVHANERDFSNFARALQDTVVKWEQDWKMFCDSCQDLEEDRMEFMKDNLWAYANAVSTVCVQDDEVCWFF